MMQTTDMHRRWLLERLADQRGFSADQAPRLLKQQLDWLENEGLLLSDSEFKQATDRERAVLPSI